MSKVLRASAACLFIFILLMLRFYLWSTLQKPEVLPKDQYVKFEATIKNEPRFYDWQQVLEIGDSKVYVDLYPRYRVGDRLHVEGYVDSRGRIYKPQVEKIGGNRGYRGYLGDLRQEIAERINRLLPTREATLLLGSVLGVDNIEKNFRDQLVKTGTIHVVVVSGQNLMIVAGIFVSLAKYLGRKQSLALASIAVFLYAVLTGFEPPVVRASLMVLAAAISVYLGRETWPLWNLILAAMIIVFLWPQAVLEISFQLTFAATLGIITLGRYLSGMWERWGVWGINAAIATSAYVFTVPIIIFYFGRVSLLSPVANLFVAEAVFPIMVLGFLTSAASLILMPVAQILAWLAFVPALYFVKIVELFAVFNIGVIETGRENIAMMLGIYAFILMITVFLTMNHSSDPNHQSDRAGRHGI